MIKKKKYLLFVMVNLFYLEKDARYNNQMKRLVYFTVRIKVI